MTKVELVQASINLSNGVIIYTFRFKYPSLHWGRHIGHTSKKIITALATSVGDPYKTIKGVVKECHPGSLNSIIKGIHEQATFAARILTAIYNKKVFGRFGKADADRAVVLFGDRVQSVLKQYNIGESHRPVTVGSKHHFIATQSGWSPYTGPR